MPPDAPEPIRDARREALFTAALWILCCLYIVGYAALFAYRQQKPPPLLFGVPTWVVWGVLAPWTVCTLLTVWFSLCVMQDEDLGAERSRPEDAA